MVFDCSNSNKQSVLKGTIRLPNEKTVETVVCLQRVDM